MYAILSVQQQERLERVANLSLMCCVCCPWGQVRGATVVIAVVIVVADAQVEAAKGGQGQASEAWESDSCRQSRRITNEKFLMMLHEVA